MEDFEPSSIKFTGRHSLLSIDPLLVISVIYLYMRAPFPVWEWPPVGYAPNSQVANLL